VNATHPRGKLVREDEGKVAMRVAVVPDKKTLVVDFGRPVVWFGLGKKEVRGLIELLTKREAEMVDASNVEFD
jgi:hypothetical protein